MFSKNDAGVNLDSLMLAASSATMSTQEVAGLLSREVSTHFSPGDSVEALYCHASHKIGLMTAYVGVSSEARRLFFESEKPDYLLSMDRGGGTHIKFGCDEQLVHREHASFVRLDRITEVNIQPASNAEGFLFPSSFIQRAISEFLDCVVPSDFHFSPNVDLTRSASSRLIGLLRSYRDLCLNENSVVAPIAISRFEDLLSCLIVDNFHHSLSHRKASISHHVITPAQVKRAVDFAKAHASEPITSNDMAAAAGVSVRSLQGNFKKFLGTTPIEYLKNIRLEGARRDLLDASPAVKVATIAKKWGFVHMGRFAIEYRLSFGVNPAMDLQKSPMRPPR